MNKQQDTTKPTKRSARDRAREFALQAMYQCLTNPADLSDIDCHTRELLGFNKADIVHYEKILSGCTNQQSQLIQEIEPLLDRKLVEISPIELGCMLLGAYELKNHLEIPYRVVINEYVELNKNFGGSDGFRYVNGILHKLANQWRSIEINAEA